MRDLNLDGGERSLIKALGFGGSAIDGETFFQRCTGVEEAEFVDTLKGLIMMGYVSTDAGSIRTFDDVKNAGFQINSGYSRELKEAMSPSPKPTKSRRVRRE